MRLGDYMRKGEGPEDPSGPCVNGRNQNDYPAMERPCLANGCPELGTITLSVVYSKMAPWFCRHHSGQDPVAFGEISRKLRLARGMVAEFPE